MTSYYQGGGANLPNTGFVSTFGPECEAGFNSTLGNLGGASGTLTQNRLYLAAVRLETPRTFVAMGWHNGATSNGSCAAGIYTIDGAKIDATAHTTQGNVSEAQAAALTLGNVVIAPGLYYFAFGTDSATSTFFRSGTQANLVRVWGGAQVAAAYANPLPASITPAWPLSSNIHMFVWASTVAVQ